MDDPLHKATVKSYSKAKGYGIVTLGDGIAILHADTLRRSTHRFEDIEAGVEMLVTLKQAASGRMVSEIKWFESRTVRYDEAGKKILFDAPVKARGDDGWGDGTWCEDGKF